MSDPDEVATVIAAAPTDAGERLREHLRGRRPDDDLAYEDLIGPMKATTGRVCLRVKAPSGDRWVRWSARDELDCCLRREDHLDVNHGWPTRTQLETWLSLHTVEPVLIEDTPFAILGEPGRREVRP